MVSRMRIHLRFAIASYAVQRSNLEPRAGGAWPPLQLARQARLVSCPENTSSYLHHLLSTDTIAVRRGRREKKKSNASSALEKIR